MEDMYLGQLDVKSAYLHSEIDEEIYLEQPEGFIDKQDQVCRLRKSIYGLKQAARDWYKSLADFLREQGFERSKNDYCLFVKPDSEGNWLYVLAWVDDLIVCGNTKEQVEKLKQDFARKFKMDDRGELSWFLGMRISRTKSGITVDQESYIQTVLENFKFRIANHFLAQPILVAS